MSIGICCFCLNEIRVQILCFYCCSRDASALFVKNVALHGSRSNLRLPPGGRGKIHTECQHEAGTQQFFHFSLPQTSHPVFAAKEPLSGKRRLTKTFAGNEFRPTRFENTRGAPVETFSYAFEISHVIHLHLRGYKSLTSRAAKELSVILSAVNSILDGIRVIELT